MLQQTGYRLGTVQQHIHNFSAVNFPIQFDAIDKAGSQLLAYVTVPTVSHEIQSMAK